MNHGLTLEEMDQLKVKQQHNKVDTVPANCANNLKDEFFKEEYSGHRIPSHETHLYHVAMDTRSFHLTLGHRLSVSRTQKFTEVNFNGMKKRNAFAGTVIEILHNPTLVKLQAEKAAKAKKLADAQALKAKIEAEEKIKAEAKTKKEAEVAAFNEKIKADRKASEKEAIQKAKKDVEAKKIPDQQPKAGTYKGDPA